MKKIKLIRLIFLICWTSVHFALKRHVWNNLNDRTKQAFENAEAKDIFFESASQTDNWLAPNSEASKSKDTEKFKGNHTVASSCVKAAKHYLNLSANEYVQGGRQNIRKSAYYLGYGLHFIEDMACPPHRDTSCDKNIRRCHARFENQNIPSNANVEKIDKNTKKVLNFGKPVSHTLNEMGLSKNDLKNGNIFTEILQLSADSKFSVSGKGEAVVGNAKNLTFITAKKKEWEKIIKSNSLLDVLNQTNHLEKEKKLMMEAIAFAMNFVVAYCNESVVTGLFFTKADAYINEPVPTRPSPSERIEIPKPLELEKLTPPLETDPSVNWGNNILILGPDYKKLAWLNVGSVNIEERNVDGGFKTLQISGKLTESRVEKLFKQGNYVFVNGDSDNERTLYIFNTKVTRDYKNNTISAEADEYFSILNNIPPFYIYDNMWKGKTDENLQPFVSGNSVNISKYFLKELLDGYYTIDDSTAIDLFTYDETGYNLNQDPKNNKSKKFTIYGLTTAQRMVSVDGTKNVLDLLREVEKKTGAKFKRHYTAVDNKIECKIELLVPFRFGREHIAPVEGIQLGRNTNELAYGTNEENNAVGVAPIIDTENESGEESSVDYQKLLKDWYNLDINHEDNVIDTAYLASGADYGTDYTFDSGSNWGEGGVDDREELTVTVMPHSVKKNNKDNNILPLAEDITVRNGVPEIIDEENVPVPKTKIYTAYGEVHLEDYIGECEPVLYLKRNQNLNSSGDVGIIVKSQGIAEDTAIEHRLFFAGNMDTASAKEGIVPDSDIIIDLGKKTVKFSKYVNKTQTKTVKKTTTKNVQKEPKGTITPPTKKGVYCTCGKKKWGTWYHTIFKNECPFCKDKGKVGRLKWHQSTSNSGKKTKGQQNKELRCQTCGADFCGACGRDKDKRRRKTLKRVTSKVNNNEKTTVNTSQIPTGWNYVDVTVSEDNEIENPRGDPGIVKDDDKKVLFGDVFTQDSVFPRFYGSVSIECFGCHFEDWAKIKSNNAKIYEFAEFPWIKEKNKPEVYTDRTDLPFNYKTITNNQGQSNHKIRNIKTNGTTVEDVLIDVANELGWTNTVDTLELMEDVTLDIVDRDNTIYNVGDIVYLKLPDGGTYKATVNETVKNPAKRGAGDVKVGQIKNTPLKGFWFKK